MKKSPRRNQLGNVVVEVAKDVEEVPNKTTGNDPVNPLRQSLMTVQSRSTGNNLKNDEEENATDATEVATKS